MCLTWNSSGLAKGGKGLFTNKVSGIRRVCLKYGTRVLGQNVRLDKGDFDNMGIQCYDSRQCYISLNGTPEMVHYWQISNSKAILHGRWNSRE